MRPTSGDSRARESFRGPLGRIPVILVNSVLQGKSATGAVDDNPGINGMGAFLSGAEYEVETEGVTASHRGIIVDE